MTKSRIFIFFCLLSSLYSCKVEVEDPSALKAGIVPKSYLTYHRFGPDTIYRAERKIDYKVTRSLICCLVLEKVKIFAVEVQGIFVELRLV